MGDLNSPRGDILKDDEYFMATACLASKRSPDPCTQVGACIVNSLNQIVGIGHNEMPKGCENLTWKWKGGTEPSYDNKYSYVLYAVQNAICSATVADLTDCRLYTNLFPSNKCSQMIIQKGIKEVIYYSNKYKDKDFTQASKKLLDEAEVFVRPYDDGTNLRNAVDINFEDVNDDQDPNLIPDLR